MIALAPTKRKPPKTEDGLYPTLHKALLPSPSKVPASSLSSALEGSKRAWEAPSDSGSILGSGPRVSTGKFYWEGGYFVGASEQCPDGAEGLAALRHLRPDLKNYGLYHSGARSKVSLPLSSSLTFLPAPEPGFPWDQGISNP